MTSIEGNLQDGNSSQSWEARLYLDGTAIKVVTNHREFVFAPQQLVVSDRLGTTSRHLTWGGRERFSTRDNDAVDALLAHLGQADKAEWIDRLESRSSIAIGAAIFIFSGVILFAVYGVPQIARGVASQVPEDLSATLARSTMSVINEVLFPSELPDARQDALAAFFREFGDIRQIEFRKAEGLGANALTLSATSVLFTDELVALTDNDNELLAVYLHELGHARLKHVERTILQNSAWVVLLSVLLGDISGAGELVISLPLVIGQSAYSRELEREADMFAVDALIDAGLDPGLLADILEKLEASHSSGETSQNSEQDASEDGSEDNVEDNIEDNEEKQWSEQVFEYLSTHPATDERVTYIRSRSV